MSEEKTIQDLNKEIWNQEKDIIQLKIDINNVKEDMDLELAKKLKSLEEIHAETKDKTLSNADKRMTVAMEDEEIKELKGTISGMEKTVRSIDAEMSYNKRLFRIMELEAQPSGSLVRIAEALESANLRIR